MWSTPEANGRYDQLIRSPHVYFTHHRIAIFMNIAADNNVGSLIRKEHTAINQDLLHYEKLKPLDRKLFDEYYLAIR
jgi:hypothetical protein